MTSRSYTFDKELELADGAAAQTSSGIAQVGGSNRIVDLGSSDAAFSGVVVLNVSALNVTGGSQSYQVQLFGSNDADQSTREYLCYLPLGTASTDGSTARMANTPTSTVGTYEIPFFNEVNGTKYRYVWLHVNTLGAGGSNPSITYNAFIGRLSGPMAP